MYLEFQIRRRKHKYLDYIKQAFRNIIEETERHIHLKTAFGYGVCLVF